MILHWCIPFTGHLLWAWAYLTLGVDAQGFMSTRPLPCIPWEPERTYAVNSKIICAAMCHRNGCFAFHFQDGLCEVWGAGVEGSSGTQLFTKTDALPCTHLEECAVNKPSDASSIYSATRLASFGNDANDNSMFENNHANVRPWWLVDLQALSLVHTVEILSRQNCCPERFHDVEFRVGLEPHVGGDFSPWPLLAFYAGPYSYADYRLNFTNPAMVLGRYVVLHKISSDNDALQLLDVNVYCAVA